MKRYISIVALLVLTLPALLAQDLISVQDLSKKLMDKKTVIVSARKSNDYKAVHIRNAVNVPYNELQTEDGIKGMLLPVNEIAKMLGKVGITTDKSVVVYDEGSGKYAGRVYWILKYLGVKDVKMLDGNLEAWKAARKPVTKSVPFPRKATFTADINSGILATKDDVAAGNAVLLDVRAANEFKGLDGKSKGHIMNAKNIEHKEVLNDDGTMKSKDQLASLFSSAGITADSNVILYCSTSVRAGIVFLALNSVMGYNNVKVYDGAYNEWVDKHPDKVSK